MSVEPTIIPFQDSQPGDTIEYEETKFTVGPHFSQGKDMKGLNFTHMMFSDKGAFGLVAEQEQNPSSDDED